MIVTIHQSNFFPYYPFFQKMAQSDLFVIMIHCQFEKNNYQNRFNIDNKWMTMSVNKGLEPINIKEYISPENDWMRIKKSLPKYKEVLDQFDECISSDSLAEINVAIICKIRHLLGIKTELVLDYPTSLKGTERLVDLCKKYEATEYISGISGRNYLNTKLFDDENIKITYQDESTMIKKPIIDILLEKINNKNV